MNRYFQFLIWALVKEFPAYIQANLLTYSGHSATYDKNGSKISSKFKIRLNEEGNYHRFTNSLRDTISQTQPLQYFL